MMSKVSLLVNSKVIDEECLINCKSAGWLPNVQDIDVKGSLMEVEDFSPPPITRGVDAEMLLKNYISNSPVVIFTSYPFNIQSKVFLSPEGSAVISSSSWSSEFPGTPYWVLVGLFIAKITENSCTNSSCLFCEGDSLVNSVCSICIEKFCNHSLNRNIASYLALCDLIISAKSLDHVPNISDYILSSQFKTRHEVIDNALVDLILNDKIAVGSKEREWLEKRSEAAITHKKNFIDGYISEFDLLPKGPMLIVARRWNSWTPAMPNSDSVVNGGHGKGGGYYFSDGQTRIVVDPGFGFLDILYKEYKICVSDIDVVVVTHDHPDHWADLGTILAMRFACCPDKPLQVLMNPSSFLMHEKYVLYYSELLSNGKPTLLKPGDGYQVGGIKIETVAVEHDEIAKHTIGDIKQELEKLGGTESLGLKIVGAFDGSSYTYSIVGDTSFPQEQKVLSRIVSFFDNSDILVLHMGSIEEAWAKDSKGLSSTIRYEGGGDSRKHLGMTGCVRFSRLINAELVVVTEFGEELKEKEDRTGAVSFIKDYSGVSKIVPADVGLCIVKNADDLYCKCTRCNSYIPLKYVTYAEHAEDGSLEYFTRAGCSSGREHLVLK